VNGRVELLAMILAVQLLLVAGFFYVDLSDASEPAPSFLEFVAEDVDRLVISGLGDGESVELSKTEGRWSLAGGTPADESKIVAVLDKLDGLSAPWPVATSEDSRQRFEVTAQAHERHIQMFAGDEPVAQIYLGTSPGYRRVHARADGADEVYSIDFSSFEAPLVNDDWLDKGLLEAVGDVTAVVREGTWTLSRAEEGWDLAAAAPAQVAGKTAVDPEAVERLISRVTDLQVTGFAPDDANLTSKGAFTVSDDAGSHGLQLFHDATEDAYAIESDRVGGRFSVATYIAEQIIVAEGDLRLAEATAQESADESQAPDPAE